jgi:hypothetical protein
MSFWVVAEDSTGEAILDLQGACTAAYAFVSTR